MVEGVKVNRTKFCMTCNIYRPSRTSHCDICGFCIERMDHHCPWLGTCVGKKNYKQFYIFLLSLCIETILIFTMCVIIMDTNIIDGEVNLGATLARYPLTIVLAILCVPAFIFVAIMLVFHTHLILKNLTTKEFFDKKW